MRWRVDRPTGDEAQGYYFSKPVPEHEFARLVLQNAGSGRLLQANSNT